MGLPFSIPPLPSVLGGSKGASPVSAPEPTTYSPLPSNWYKSLPYGFRFMARGSTENDDSKAVTFYLPILPSNINVVTQFATNTITTLYGIVEEHSEVRYYDIDISGTTGITPRWIKARENGTDIGSISSTGRAEFTNDSIDLGGFLPEVTNTINQVKNLAQDISGTLFGQEPPATGVDANKTGYMAFHNFYRFLLNYKNDTAGLGTSKSSPRKTHPLQFLNYKDGIKYDVVIQNFTLSRSADNPMLYNYNIKMRAFNLRSVDASSAELEQQQLAKLGLGDIKAQSTFAGLTSVVGNATTLIGGLL